MGIHDDEVELKHSKRIIVKRIKISNFVSLREATDEEVIKYAREFKYKDTIQEEEEEVEYELTLEGKKRLRMKLAIEEIILGENVYKAAKQYGVNYSTLRNYYR